MNHTNMNINCQKPLCPPLAYICCSTSAKVAIVNLAEGRHLGDIPCGEDSNPYYIVINAADNMAYVADYAHKKILKLDLTSNQLILQAAVVSWPRGLDLSPCGQYLYVVFDDEPIMQILNSKLENLGQIALPSSSGSVTVTNGGSQAYVTQPVLNQTAVIDLCNQTLIRLIDTGTNPGRMTYSAKESLLLVAGRDSQTLTPIDTCQLCSYPNITLSGSPSGLALTSGNQQCLVAIPRDNEAAMVTLCSQQVTARIPVGDVPGGVAASKFYPLAAICNQISSTVSIINTATLSVTSTLSVGNGPAGIAIVG